MYCEKCGQQLPDHATFCGKCGARILEASNGFNTPDERTVNASASNSKMRRIIIGICLLVGVIIVGGVFFLRRDREEIQSMESNTNNTVVQSGEEPWSDEALYDSEEEPSEEATQNPEEDDRNEDNLTEDINESLIGDVSVGEIVTFGTYEQDDYPLNDAEPLEWIVLDRQDGKALLLSRYVIDCKQYHGKCCDITWAECDLRNWLNTTFYETAFDEMEQQQIIEAEVLNPDNEVYGTPGGETTYDKVFLLSLSEVDRYFSTYEERATSPTDYALKRVTNKNSAEWWLRSPGLYSKYAAYVTSTGFPHTNAYSGHNSYEVYHTTIGVRPAMWVSIDEWDGEVIHDVEEEQNENFIEEVNESLIGNVNVGDFVTFGTYEQDNNLSNGAEPLEWIILDQQDGMALLLSRYVIDCKRYHEDLCDITWAECNLRNWLNTTFYETAFDEKEQRQILETEVLNPDNEKYGLPGGVTTYDKVFLLSLSEADRYFISREDRRTKVASYAMDSNSRTDGGNYASWWLRSPGRYSVHAAYVYSSGVVIDYGGGVNLSSIGVRPALWVSID